MKNLKNNFDSFQTEQKGTEKDQALTSKNMSKKERIRKEQILRLVERISQITEKQRQWAIQNCVEYYGYYYTDKCTCLNCSEKFNFKKNNENVVCPKCKVKLILKESRNRTYKGYKYFVIAQSVGIFQIIRNFKINYNFKINKRPTFHITEVLQHWVADNGEREVFSLKHNVSFYMDSWNEKLQFRNKKNTNLYDIYPYAYYPYSAFKKQYRKIGIDKNLQGMTFIEAINLIPNNPKAETLLKARYYRLIYRFKDWEQYINEYWKTIRIVLRNKYEIKNIRDYFDYLQFLKNFNKDLLNPKYVCPEDLSKEHNKYMRKTDERRKLIKKEMLMAQIKEDEKKYQLKINKLKDFCIENKEFVIKVIDSVQKIAYEGEKLKHCVFQREYHKKDNSLLLSARLKERIDEPLETVEISLERMKILQCRGLFNKPSEFNNQIKNLINQSVIPQLKKYL